MNIKGLATVASLTGLLAISCELLAAPPNIGICSDCHGTDGTGGAGGVPAGGIPIIAGIPAAHLEEALFAYKDASRGCVTGEVMCEMTQDLTDEEIEGYAAHYSSMKRVAAREERVAALAEQGERIHAEQCAICHVRPDDPKVDESLGIPLHGQRSEYLQIAFDAYRSGDRETLVPDMAEQLERLSAQEVAALVNYYSSYRP